MPCASIKQSPTKKCDVMPSTVLVVDDSTAIRKFVMFALRSNGLNVLTAQDGLDALETLARHSVDLVITDLNMPKLDGFGLVRKLRLEQNSERLPIIILSSLSGEADVEAGLEAGADAYLVKPFNQARLKYEVAKFLN